MEQHRQFSKKILELRKKAGLTQRELAARVGVDFSYLSKIENGVLPPPSESVISSLARALNTGENELLILAGKLPSLIARDLTATFGNRIRELRRKAGLTQRELAARIGVDFSYLSKIENGVLPPPSESVISSLARKLNTGENELLISAGKIPAVMAQKSPRELARIIRTSYRTKSPAGFSARAGSTVQKIKARGAAMSGTLTGKLQVPSFTLVRKNLKILLPVILVITLSSLVWFAPMAQALSVSVSPASGSGTLGNPYTFTVTINVHDVDRLPIQSVDMQISKGSSYVVNCTNLPIPTSPSSQASATYTPTGAGTVSVTGTSGANWAFASASRYGYGYGYQTGTVGQITFPGTTSGYGYGYSGTYIGPTTLTYSVSWTSPSGWPTGDYNVRVIVYGTTGDTSKAFTNSTAATITLSQPTGVGEVLVPGGGGPAPTPTPGVTSVSSSINQQGVFTRSVTIRSEDNKVSLSINQGTTGMTQQGSPLSQISVKEMASPPPPPAGANVIGLSYDFGPDGATFNPPLRLTFSYNPADIPAGVAEEDLVLVYWNGSAWIELDNITVDPARNTITGEAGHFTAFAVIAHSDPASFTAGDLTITPSEANPGEVVNITTRVANSGDLTGTYTLILKINNIEVNTREISLAGGESRQVTFTTTREVGGTYNVTVNGLSGSFTVKTAAAPPTSPSPAPTPSPTASPTAPPTATAPPPTATPTTPPVTPPPTTNWLLLGLIGAAMIIVVGSVLWYAFKVIRRYD